MTQGSDRPISRRLPAVIAVSMLMLLVALDYAAYPANPYRAPAVLALGSGAESAGGFCGSLPD